MKTHPLTWITAEALIKELLEAGEYEDCLLISLGVFTGYRISNILDLKISDVKGKSVIAVSQEVKTKKKRVVPLNDRAQAIISDCFECMTFPPSQEFIFVSKSGTKRGNRLTPDGANYRIKAIFSKWNIETANDSSHTFRKTFARRHVDLIWEKTGDFNCALYVVSKMMNHADIYETMNYTGYTTELMDYSYEKMMA